VPIEATGGDVAAVELTATGVGAALAFDPPDTDFGAWLAGGLTDLREGTVRDGLGRNVGDLAAAGVRGVRVMRPCSQTRRRSWSSLPAT
jgi:hypothetical protein